MQKKLRISVYILLSFAFMLSVKTAYAAVPENIQKEIQYETTNPEEKKQFPERLEQDGAVYLLTGTTYKIQDKTPVQEKKTVYVTKKSKVIRDNESYSPEEEITKDGISYKLVQTEKKKKTLETAYSQTVTGYSEYDSMTAARKAPSIKRIFARSPRTGETVSVACKKKGSIQKTSDTWVDTYIDIEFVAYDATHFAWQDILVEKNVKEPLKGYHKELLQSVGGNSENYKIQRIAWQGKSYKNKQGVLCRKARAYVQKKMPHFRVNYSGTRTEKAVKGIVFTSTYAGEKLVESGNVSYSMLAIATYHMEEKDIPVVGITVGIVVTVLLTVGILFLIKRKRKSKKPNI